MWPRSGYSLDMKRTDEVFTTRNGAKDYHLAVTRSNGTAWVETFTSCRALVLRWAELKAAGHKISRGVRRSSH